MGTVEVIQGDLTQIEADAIVNAANEGLAQGGGVCGAIFKAAGASQLTHACEKLGSCPTGHAVITPAFDITSAKHIIHAVGPVYSHYQPQQSRELLRSAYQSAIDLAGENNCQSIAFPAISTGIYGYPLEEACTEAVAVCQAAAASKAIHIKLVAFDSRTAECLRSHLH
ncbi:MAG: macro domain-containing protein [Pseudomonadota bacterium]